MALRFFHTAHGVSYSSGSYSGTFLRRVYKDIDFSVPSSGSTYWNVTENKGRVQDGESQTDKSVITTSADSAVEYYNSIMLIGESFARTDTVRFAIDFRLSESSTSSIPAYVFTVNNAFSGLNRNIEEPPVTQTFLYMIYDRSDDTFKLKNGSTVLATITGYPESSLKNSTSSQGWVHFEVELNIDAGTVNIWGNNTNSISLTGVNFSGTTGNVESIAALGGKYARMGSFAIWGDVVAGNDPWVGYIGDFITSIHTANANYISGHTSGSYTDISTPNFFSSSGYLRFTQDNAESLLEFDNTFNSNDILNVIAMPLAYQGDAGSGRYQLVAEINGAKYYSAEISERVVGYSAFGYPHGGYPWIRQVWAVNPDTGLPWAAAEFNSAKFGILTHIPA